MVRISTIYGNVSGEFCQVSFWSFTVADVVIAAVVLIGPVAAVFVTRWVDKKREDRSRKLDVFKTLMRTRRNPISPEHVGALNLVELEFAESMEVRSNLEALMKHLGTEQQRLQREVVVEETPKDEAARRNSEFGQRLADERQRLLAKLLHSIGSSLGFKVQQLEIFEGGYTPQGWADVELEQRIIRNYFLDLYTGHRVVPVAVVDYRRQESSEGAETESDTGSSEEKASQDKTA